MAHARARSSRRSIAVGKEEDGPSTCRSGCSTTGPRSARPCSASSPGCAPRRTTSASCFPVDCPLVTAGTLRRLAEERAVAADRPAARCVREGDAARRSNAGSPRASSRSAGVNPNVVEVDEAELLNVNTRMDLIAAAIADWALPRDDVKAAVVVGSQTRADTPADRWSDLDVILLVDDPEPYARDETWVAEFGRPVLTFLEPTAVGDQRERRVLYEDGEDVDLPADSRRRARAHRLERGRAAAPRARLPRARGQDRPLGALARGGGDGRRSPGRRRSANSPSSRATSGSTRSGARRSSAGARY